ncbi:hypothetical protein J4E05_16895 [Thalassospira sp. NFXS8]|uniref:hypothetical protein n=1 Tax=Thalassospira sp. NFXS8 TaxID=2819093 RepID=UPI0032DEE20B
MIKISFGTVLFESMGVRQADRYSCKRHQCANRAMRDADLMEAVMTKALRYNVETTR